MDSLFPKGYTIFCMSYHKRYEDSYLDDEDFELEKSTDIEKILSFIEKAALIPEDAERIKRLLALWGRLSEIAEAKGDRDLYYRSLDEMTNLR
jgi:hypothetical protein